ncbi:MAG: hypothetical protein CMJ81_20820 [Planctomycetaceae bacterium]|nr:hypothetical protein [Planctomycetaceae bacterium]MBP62481.1 hypothetical protein [Planctomycetaceae bacterium]
MSIGHIGEDVPDTCVIQQTWPCSVGRLRHHRLILPGNGDDNPGTVGRFKSPMTADLPSFSACPTVAEPPNGQVKKTVRFRNRTCPQRKNFFEYLTEM